MGAAESKSDGCWSGLASKPQPIKKKRAPPADDPNHSVCPAPLNAATLERVDTLVTAQTMTNVVVTPQNVECAEHAVEVGDTPRTVAVHVKEEYREGFIDGKEQTVEVESASFTPCAVADHLAEDTLLYTDTMEDARVMYEGKTQPSSDDDSTDVSMPQCAGEDVDAWTMEKYKGDILEGQDSSAVDSGQPVVTGRDSAGGECRKALMKIQAEANGGMGRDDAVVECVADVKRTEGVEVKNESEDEADGIEENKDVMGATTKERTKSDEVKASGVIEEGSKEEDGTDAKMAKGVTKEVFMPLEVKMAKGVTKEVVTPLEVKMAKGVTKEVVTPLEVKMAKGVTKEVVTPLEVKMAKGVTKEVVTPLEVKMAKGVTKEVIMPLEVKMAKGVTKEVVTPLEVKMAKGVTKEVIMPLEVKMAKSVTKEVAMPLEVKMAKGVTKEVVTPLEVKMAKGVTKEVVMPLEGDVKNCAKTENWVVIETENADEKKDTQDMGVQIGAKPKDIADTYSEGAAEDDTEEGEVESAETEASPLREVNEVAGEGTKKIDKDALGTKAVEAAVEKGTCGCSAQALEAHRDVRRTTPHTLDHIDVAQNVAQITQRACDADDVLASEAAAKDVLASEATGSVVCESDDARCVDGAEEKTGYHDTSTAACSSPTHGAREKRFDDPRNPARVVVQADGADDTEHHRTSDAVCAVVEPEASLSVQNTLVTADGAEDGAATEDNDGVKDVRSARAMFEKKIQVASCTKASHTKLAHLQNVRSATQMFEKQMERAATTTTSTKKVDFVQDVSSSKKVFQEGIDKKDGHATLYWGSHRAKEFYCLKTVKGERSQPHCEASSSSTQHSLGPM